MLRLTSQGIEYLLPDNHVPFFCVAMDRLYRRRTSLKVSADKFRVKKFVTASWEFDHTHTLTIDQCHAFGYTPYLSPSRMSSRLLKELEGGLLPLPPWLESPVGDHIVDEDEGEDEAEQWHRPGVLPSVRRLPGVSDLSLAPIGSCWHFDQHQYVLLDIALAGRRTMFVLHI